MIHPWLIVARCLANAVLEALDGAGCPCAREYATITPKDGAWLPGKAGGPCGCDQLVVTPGTIVRPVAGVADLGLYLSPDTKGIAPGLTAVEYRVQHGTCVAETFTQPGSVWDLDPDDEVNVGSEWEEAGRAIAARYAVTSAAIPLWEDACCAALNRPVRTRIITAEQWGPEGGCVGTDMRVEAFL
jgi:hypothetical protein